MANKISPCLWFNNNADQAMKFYVSLFKGKIKSKVKYSDAGVKASGMPKGSLMSVSFEIFGQEFLGINGGPVFQKNPSISFFVGCKDAKQVDAYYKKLAAGGKTLMKLDRYPWSERYAWVQDRYGTSWQLTVGKPGLWPSLLFTQKQNGNAAKAIKHYTSMFKKSKVNAVMKHAAPSKGIAYANITLDGSNLSLMDGGTGHAFSFSEGISLMIYCKDQKEIDHFWSKLTKGGQEGPCGWLKDRFGVSWQIVVHDFEKLLTSPKADKYMAALMTMKKPDLERLKAAAK